MKPVVRSLAAWWDNEPLLYGLPIVIFAALGFLTSHPIVGVVAGFLTSALVDMLAGYVQEGLEREDYHMWQTYKHYCEDVKAVRKALGLSELEPPPEVEHDEWWQSASGRRHDRYLDRESREDLYSVHSSRFSGYGWTRSYQWQKRLRQSRKLRTENNRRKDLVWPAA